MRIADRLLGISASPTMAVMQEAQELRAQGIDIIDLGPGQPDFNTPEHIREAGVFAIREGLTRYTPAAGTTELRQAVAEKYNREWGTDFSLENVVITSGAKHAIYNACMAVFQSGDEVLNPSPYWVTFPEVIKITGAAPVTVPTTFDHGFILSSSSVQDRLRQRTRGLIVNTPNNPTGAVLPSEVLLELVELGRERGLFLLFDETYDRFTYGGKKHTSLAKFASRLANGFAIVGSFSKTYAMTGWRIGYCVGPNSLIQKIIEFQSHQTGNPCSISQHAALAALRGGDECFESMQKEYEKRREFVLEGLKSISGMSCTCPEGAFYVFPKVSESMRRIGVDSSADYSRFLIKRARVATVPGSAFGLEGHIRLSYATSLENLKEALERIREALA